MALNSSGSRFKLNGEFGGTFDGNAIPVSFSFETLDTFASGTGIDQADLAWWDTSRALAATSEDLDLAGGLTDPFGATINFAKIKGIYVKNKSLVAGETIKIGGAASNQFLLFDDATDIYELGPGGLFQIWEPSLAGLPVTAGTGDLLKIDSGAATLTYDICIVGTSV